MENVVTINYETDNSILNCPENLYDLEFKTSMGDDGVSILKTNDRLWFALNGSCAVPRENRVDCRFIRRHPYMPKPVTALGKPVASFYIYVERLAELWQRIFKRLGDISEAISKSEEGLMENSARIEFTEMLTRENTIWMQTASHVSVIYFVLSISTTTATSSQKIGRKK